MPNTQTCQPARLDAFLNGKLALRDEEQLAAHLDECATCRLRLDELAAEPNSWTQATAFLKDDALDCVLISGFSDEPHPLHPQIKQVLDVLGATDDPAMLGRLGSYEVSGVVGAGGMGVVLKAFDRPPRSNCGHQSHGAPPRQQRCGASTIFARSSSCCRRDPSQRDRHLRSGHGYSLALPRNALRWRCLTAKAIGH